MFGQILLAVDGSEHSKRAATVASGLAQLAGSEVLVLHVHEEEVGTIGRAGPPSLEAPDEATSLVNAFVSEVQRPGVMVRGETHASASGGIAPAILSSADSFNADLIVMGTRGLSDFSALLIGSVAHKVIHYARCPVLVVR